MQIHIHKIKNSQSILQMNPGATTSRPLPVASYGSDRPRGGDIARRKPGDSDN